MSSAAAFVQRTLVRGILLIVPVAITYAILRWLFLFITGFSAPLVDRLITAAGPPAADLWPAYLTPVVAILLTFGIVLLVGLVGGYYVGQRTLAWFEQVALKLPLVKWVYGPARRLMDAFSATGSGAFREVVFVEYPRRGLWCLGFVTATAGDRVQVGPPGTVFVFVPTSPNPTSGYTVVMDRAEAVPANMTVEEGLTLIVSGGFITPTQRRRPS